MQNTEGFEKEVTDSFYVEVMGQTEKEEATFYLDCEEISHEDNGVKKYQTIIYLPFLTKSAWTATSYSRDKLKQRAIKTIESKLRTKYKDIMKRDYNHRERFKRFVEIVDKSKNIDFKLEYSNGLNHKAPDEKIGDKTVAEIEHELDKKISENPNDYQFKLSWKKFIQMLLNGKCSYCGLSISQVYTLAEKKELFTKRSRGYTLEVDQIDPYGNYTDENCAPSCYWCNNAKTDEFKVGEFKEIARGINKVWNLRLDDEISFPENSGIWEQ